MKWLPLWVAWILHATIQNVFALVTWHLGFVHPCCEVFVLPLFFTGCISITLFLYCLMMCVAVALICCFRLKCCSFPTSSVIFWSFGNVGWESSVSIATCYRLDSPGIESWCGQDFLHSSKPALGSTQLPIQWVPGRFPGGKAARTLRRPPTPISYQG